MGVIASNKTYKAAKFDSFVFHFFQSKLCNDTKSNFSKMKNYFILLFTLITLSTTAQSLDWAGQFGGLGEDVVLAMHIDLDGNIYTTGYFTDEADFDIGEPVYYLTSNGMYDIFIQKTDPAGNLLWAKSYGGAGFDLGSAITVDAAGNVYITGNYAETVDFSPGPGAALTSAGMQDMFLLKLNNEGDFLWAKSMGGVGYEQALDMEIAPTGNVFLLGHFGLAVDFDPSAEDYTLTGVGSNDTFILQLNADGNFISAKRYGGAETDIAMDMEFTEFGDLYITGYFEGTADLNPHDLEVDNFTAEANSMSGYVIHLNNAGNFVSAGITHGGVVRSNSIEVDQNGFVYIAGYFYNTVNFNHHLPGNENFIYEGGDQGNGFVMKLNPMGNVEWARHFESDETVFGFEMEVGSNGKIYTSGFFAGTADFDPSANNFLLTKESANMTDAYLSVLDENGLFVNAYQFGGADFIDNHTLGIDANNAIYLSAHFEATVDLNPLPEASQAATALDFRDSYLIKMSTEGTGLADEREPNFSVYPIPATERIFIAGSTPFAGKNYTLFDLRGRKVQYGQISSNNSIPLQGIHSGLFLLKVTDMGSMPIMVR